LIRVTVCSCGFGGV